MIVRIFDYRDPMSWGAFPQLAARIAAFAEEDPCLEVGKELIPNLVRSFVSVVIPPVIPIPHMLLFFGEDEGQVRAHVLLQVTNSNGALGVGLIQYQTDKGYRWTREQIVSMHVETKQWALRHGVKPTAALKTLARTKAHARAYRTFYDWHETGAIHMAKPLSEIPDEIPGGSDGQG